MSNRQSFWEIYVVENKEQDDAGDGICLCTNEDKAEALLPILQDFATYNNGTLAIRHIEIIADVDLNFGNY